MIVFNLINRLRILQYNLYSGTLFYTNALISSSLWVCGLGPFNEYSQVPTQQRQGVPVNIAVIHKLLLYIIIYMTVINKSMQ